ncbi:protein ADP-ribosyltransferase PARP3-like isoform X3 [Arachis hypogaea]|uniref:protein ADP-ribosyltransferase PARP3-like isoform X3 n=1 Tax=Arachis hypogaea TaxID=3818 RepID=UPI003B22754E
MVHYDALHLGLSFSEIIKRLQNMLLLSLEGVRDITVASHLIGDMSGSTIDDPLSETYNKLGCLISPLEKDSDDYDMIVKYLERTYEPVKVGDMDHKAQIFLGTCTRGSYQLYVHYQCQDTRCDKLCYLV